MLSSAVRVGSGLLLALVMAAEVVAQSPDPVLSPDPHLESAPQESPVSEEKTMRITSTAFEHEGDIPERYTCDGIDVSPPLSIDDIPTGTVSLALLVDDPDAPAGTWDHWVEYDIEPVAEIAEDVEALGTPGTNSWGRTGYGKTRIGRCNHGGRG